MGTELDASLRDSMNKYLHKFYLSLQEGGNALGTFLKTLTSFNDTVLKHHNQIEAQTIDTIYQFESLIGNVSNGIFQIEQETDHLRDNIASDLLNVFEGMENLSINDKSTTMKKEALPRYTQRSHQWLCANLHNPYPTKDLRKNISRETNTPVKDIDAWFMDVRKRIGWNKLRKTRFGNKQEKIVAAATRFFRPGISSFKDDLGASLMSEMDSNDNYRAEFLAIEREARSLYADRFPDMTPVSSPSIAQSFQPASARKDSTTKDSVLIPHHIENTLISYPTPKPSPSYSESVSPSTTPLLIPIKPRKRRRSLSSSSCEDSGNNTESQPLKRPRLHNTQLDISEDVSTLPSPFHSNVSTTPTIEQPIATNQLDITSPFPVAKTGLKRKRRLSDGESQGLPKRPNNALCIPRLQAVSDPLPIIESHEEIFDIWSPSSIESSDYFSDSIPSPANVEDIVSSGGPFEVDLHQYIFVDDNSGIKQTELSGNGDFVELISPCNDPKASLMNGSGITFQDGSLNLLEATNFRFDSMPTLLYEDNLQSSIIPSYDDFATFQDSEIFSLVHGCLPDTDTASPLDADSFHSAHQDEKLFLGDSSHTNSGHFSITGIQDVKRARAQALREELARYEAEGL